jgi:hypothetical protein
MNRTQGGGLSAVSVLTIAFVVLKLCGVIAWSWWWVLSPVWIPAAGVVIVAALLTAGMCIAAAVEARQRARRLLRQRRTRPRGMR